MDKHSTAARLLDYRNELIAGGVSEDSADIMIRDAAGRIIQNYGLQTRLVKSEE